MRQFLAKHKFPVFERQIHSLDHVLHDILQFTKLYFTLKEIRFLSSNLTVGSKIIRALEIIRVKKLMLKAIL